MSVRFCSGISHIVCVPFRLCGKQSMFTPSSVAIVVLISCREGRYGLLMIVNARKFGMVKNIGITIKEMDNIIGRR